MDNFRSKLEKIHIIHKLSTKVWIMCINVDVKLNNYFVTINNFFYIEEINTDLTSYKQAICG
jgi:hypothetical protein